MIVVKHPNGYEGTLYGKRSLSISKDGREVFHTGFRSVETEEELYELLEDIPEFFKVLERVSEENNVSND